MTDEREYFHSQLLKLDKQLEAAEREGDAERTDRIKRQIYKFQRMEERAKFREKRQMDFVEIAGNILLEKDFITLRDTQEILHYENGIYRKGGEIIVNELAKRISDEEISQHKTKEVLFQIQTETYTDRDKLNANINYIPVLNGIYDLESKTLLNHSPKHFLTFQLPVYYDPTADCPKIRKFLEEVVYPNDIPLLQEVSGYCLYRKYLIQKAILLHGSGSNGKSIYLEVLKTMLGQENCCSIGLQDLETNRFAKAGLYAKHANLYADLSDEALRTTGTFKIATGGDQITAERKFGQPFNFQNYAKFILSMNKIPESKDKTDAFFRRNTIISFPYTFTENGENGTKLMDTDLINKLTTQEELSGFFNWALKGLERLLAKGKFSYSLSTEKIRDKYIRLSDSLGAFVMDSIKLSVHRAVTKDDFYLAYVDYCNKNGVSPKSKKAVGMDLPGYLRVESQKLPTDKGRALCWVGIAFSDPLIGKTLDMPDMVDTCPASGQNAGQPKMEDYYDVD